MDMKVDPTKIKALRLEKSWSQEKLAEEACVGLRTIQRMEIDGTASLKSRLAVAEALHVQPAELDPENTRTEANLPEENTSIASSSSPRNRRGFFSYPGPTSFGHRIRTPLLVVLWVLTVVTGGALTVATAAASIAAIFDPDVAISQVIFASIPILVIFLVCLGLYSFFRRLTSEPQTKQSR